MNGFIKTELSRQGIVGCLMGQPVKENAFREIQNKLATTHLLDIQANFAEECLARYGLIISEAEDRLCGFYRAAVHHVARQGHITPEQYRGLDHLILALGLPAAKAKEIHQSVVRPMFETFVEYAMADRRLTQEEKVKLNSLTAEFRIPENVALEIYKKRAQQVLQEELDSALADKRLSSEEDQQLTEMAKALGGTLTLDPTTERTLERYRLLWRYTQGDLPEIEVPVRLQRGERCAAAITASHYELKTVTTRVRYSGPTASIKIMKGVRWRLGDIAVSSVTQEVMKLLDSGTLYFTTKRLLFDGSRKSASITLEKVLNFTFYENALLVEKDTGKDQIFEFASEDAEMLDAILKGLLGLDREK